MHSAGGLPSVKPALRQRRQKFDLDGEAGRDRPLGGGNTDTLHGGSGADTLQGNNAKDFLYGDGGGDFLNGGAANDELFGGFGGDTLLGATGDDFLSGDAGADIFRFRANHGDDRILDFEDGADIIQFDINSVQDIGDLTISDNFAGTAVIVDYGTGTIRVDGTTAAALTASDFSFL